MLGPMGSRPVMESHLQQRVDEEVASIGATAVARAGLGALNASARLRLGQILKTDLGVPVPDDLVLEATSVEGLASDLIDLVIGSITASLGSSSRD